MDGNQPGPGWWVASDGRWYPPEQHPAAQPQVPGGPGAAPTTPEWIAPSKGAAPAGPSGSGNRTAWAIVAVAVSAFVLLGAVGAAVLLLRDGGMDVDAAAAVVADRARDVDIPDDEGYVDIDECLVGDEAALLESASAEVSIPTDALDGDQEVSAGEWSDEDGEDPVVLFICGRGNAETGDSEDPYVGASFYVGSVPDEGYEDRTNATFDVSWYPSREVLGGTLHSYCYESTDDESEPSCEAAWVDPDGKLMVGLFVNGLSSDEDLGPGLEPVIADIVDHVAGS